MGSLNPERVPGGTPPGLILNDFLNLFLQGRLEQTSSILKELADSGKEKK